MRAIHLCVSQLLLRGSMPLDLAAAPIKIWTCMCAHAHRTVNAIRSRQGLGRGSWCWTGCPYYPSGVVVVAAITVVAVAVGVAAVVVAVVFFVVIIVVAVSTCSCRCTEGEVILK